MYKQKEREGYIECCTTYSFPSHSGPGTSDPYCQLAVVSEALTENLTKDLAHWLEEGQGVGQEDILTSTVIQKTLDPEWNETFEMQVTICMDIMQSSTNMQ